MKIAARIFDSLEGWFGSQAEFIDCRFSGPSIFRRRDQTIPEFERIWQTVGAVKP